MMNNVRPNIKFINWVRLHSTAGLTDILEFSRYDRFVDCWSITVGEVETANPTMEFLIKLYNEHND